MIVMTDICLRWDKYEYQTYKSRARSRTIVFSQIPRISGAVGFQPSLAKPILFGSESPDQYSFPVVASLTVSSIMDVSPRPPSDESPLPPLPPAQKYTGSPTDFLKGVVGKRVIVRLTSGIDYQGQFLRLVLLMMSTKKH